MGEGVSRKLMGANKLPIGMGRAKQHHKSDGSENQVHTHDSDLSLTMA